MILCCRATIPAALSMDERGPKISLRTKLRQLCPCNEGWIGEPHPDHGWPHDDCAGPGMPCPRLQPRRSANNAGRLAVGTSNSPRHVLRSRPLCLPGSNASTGTASLRTSVICSAWARRAETSASTCELWTHQLGWEVRLEINGDLQRSEVFRSQDDVLTACEAWKAVMMTKGWHG